MRSQAPRKRKKRRTGRPKKRDYFNWRKALRNNNMVGWIVVLAVVFLAILLVNALEVRRSNRGAISRVHSRTLFRPTEIPEGTPDHLRPIINRVAREVGMCPCLITEIMRQESRFNPRAQSSAGAMGLMQVTPEAMRDLRLKGRFTGDVWDPYANVRMGAEYYRLLETHYLRGVPRPRGITLRQASLAAYNAGPTRTIRMLQRERRLPGNAETRNYVEVIERRLGDNGC